MLTGETDPILKFLRSHTCDGHVPDILAIEAAANFRVMGGLTRLLTALRRVAEIDREYLRRASGYQPETIAWRIVSSFPKGEMIDRERLRERIADALRERP